jgi:cytochrome c553
MTKTIRTVMLLAAVFSLAGVARLAQAADAKAGQATYNLKCKSCHGVDGTANPAIAKMMGVPMADLKSAEVQAKSEADLKTVIEKGKGKMKPVAGLSAGDVDNVVAFLRTLKK